MTPNSQGAIVVLGAMFGARYPELMPAAARRGLAVLGIDARSPFKERFDEARRTHRDHPLAPIVELAWCDGDSHEDVLEQVVAWQARYDIRAVLAFGEDFVTAAALVADFLGLPSPGLRASRVCRDKLLQRRYLADWSPRSLFIPPTARRERAATWDVFPAVLKPTGRNASSGVVRIDDRAQLLAALDDYDEGEPLLVERLVSGHEVSVEALSQDGRVIFASVTGKRTTESCGQFFVEMGHSAPDPDIPEATRAAVLEANRAILARLQFASGISHAEFRIAPDGEVCLMEIAARAAGDSIVTLYHLATGTPMEEAMLAVALGEPATYPQPRRFARQVYLRHEPGVLRGVRVDGLPAQVTWLPDRWMWPPVTPVSGDGALHMVVSGRAAGAELDEIRQSGDRSLMYVIDAPTIAALDALEARCDAAISLDIEAA